MTSPSAPRFAFWLLERLLPETERDAVMGDLAEEYVLRARSASLSTVSYWYWGQVFRSIPPVVWSSVRRGDWLRTLSVAIGAYIAAGVLEFAGDAAISKLVPPGTLVHAALGLIAGLSTMVLGGYVAARIRPGAAAVMAGIVMVSVAVLMVTKSDSVPLWYQLAFLIARSIGFVGWWNAFPEEADATMELMRLDVRTRQQWRAWLRKHHASSPGVWLVFHKDHTLVKSVPYEDSVRQALCFGWIDSLIKRLDDDRYARKFTPRKPSSKWSEINRRRYADLEAAGLLAPAGLTAAPTGNTAAPHPAIPDLPAYIAEALQGSPKAWGFFQELAPTYRRHFVGWIHTAKQPETREKRICESIALLAAGKKLGLK